MAKKSNLNNVDNKLKVKNTKVPKNAIIRQTIESEISLQRLQQEMSMWRQAVLSAENVINPLRTELYRGYKDAVLDAHLSAVWQNFKNAILGCDFVVFKKGKIQADQTEFILKQWFYEFCNHALDSKLWGNSLIQFGNIVDNEIMNVDLVPRWYVRPELNLVVPMFGALQGADFTEAPYKDWTLSINGNGSKQDLGLLLKIMPYYLWKKTALAAWGNYVQLMGVPIRTIKTDTTDAVALRNAQRMVKDMGSSLAAVIDKEDTLELIESKSSSVSENFMGLINICNFEMSKIILGESSSMDPKAFVGSVVVHEKTKDQNIEATIKWLENIFKYQLVPFLNSHGLPFDGCEIKIQNDQVLTLAEKSKILVSLLPFYEVPEDYIMNEFGIPTVKRTQPNGMVAQSENDITENYDKADETSTETRTQVTEDDELSNSPIREGWLKDMKQETNQKEV